MSDPAGEKARDDLVVVLPAPLNTEAFPRKVLRPLGDEPILSRLIQAAFRVVVERSQVVVLTDDDEVVLLAERQGCTAFAVAREGRGDLQDPKLILAAAERVERVSGRRASAVAVLYPTVPLVSEQDLRLGIDTLLRSDTYRTVLSACETTHRSWTARNGSYVVESQPADDAIGHAPSYREIPSFVITRRDVIAESRLIEEPVGLALIPAERAWEVRSVHDWWGLDRLVRRKRIVFVVIGNSEVGLGHAYRTTLLAHDLVGHEILFVIARDHEMAAEHVRRHRFPVVRQGEEDLAETVLSLDPHVVINDILATATDYMGVLKSGGMPIVNFEDLGPGADLADRVVNAIYEEQNTGPNHLNGPDYYCIRDEFLQARPAPFRDAVEEVLITFGGTDANDLARRVAGLILPVVGARGIRVSIVTGPGYLHLEALREFLACQPEDGLELANGTKRISEYMARADIALSSAGRTVFELAAMRTPAVILASHEREERHTFASEANGMRYLGRHDTVSDEEIVHAFLELLDCADVRRSLYENTDGIDVKGGRRRVISALTSVIEGAS